MSWEPRTSWVVVLVVAALGVVFLLMRTRQALEPELVALHVAVQAAGAEAARVGPVEIQAGQGFRLHAVAEAKDWRGEPLFYTEAPAVELRGELVDEARLRRWARGETASILWFTVEGAPPFAEISSGDQLARVGYREIFRADWPRAWSIPGRLDPTVENLLPGQEGASRDARFGVQRFHARLEVFEKEGTILPALKLKSPGAAELEASQRPIPTVTALLSGTLEPLSRAFGLPQIEPSKKAPAEVREAIAGRIARGLAFSRLPLLASWLAGAGITWEDLDWHAVDLATEVEWGGQGDLLRAGSKIAFAIEDRGRVGLLDDADVCLDFDRGATARSLGEIFIGEGLIERARAPLASGETVTVKGERR